MKTHYAQCDKVNESDNHDYWGDTACGLVECESPMTENLKEITCKNCLKVMFKYKDFKHDLELVAKIYGIPKKMLYAEVKPMTFKNKGMKLTKPKKRGGCNPSK